MLDIIDVSKVDKKLIAIKAKYNHEALFFYTLNKTEDFYLGVEEFDFELDGYQIRLIEDITDAMLVENFSAEINLKEGLLEKIKDYKINLTNFQTIFNDLYLMDKIISIEREYDDEDYFFVIGKIVKVTDYSIWFKDFNVDGNWNEEINIIPFDIITTVRFDSKYINIWSKYISEVKL